jgi:hypothetical protein
MRKVYLLPFFLFAFSYAQAQSKPKPSLYGAVNFATHGTGDMFGMMFQAGINQTLRKRLSLQYEIGFTHHWASDDFPLNVLDPRYPADNPLWVTAGIQFIPRLVFNVTGKSFSGLKIGVGPMLRYQLNGSPLAYGISYDPPLDIRPRYEIIEVDRNHFNAGYNVAIMYDFKAFRRSGLGVSIHFQNDTNGDVIAALGIRYTHLFH